MQREEAEAEAERRNRDDPKAARFEFYALDQSAGLADDAWYAATKVLGDLYLRAGQKAKAESLFDRFEKITAGRAEYLRERIISHCPDSLLAVLVRERIAVDAVDYAWELTSPLPDALREQLDHGQEGELDRGQHRHQRRTPNNHIQL